MLSSSTEPALLLKEEVDNGRDDALPVVDEAEVLASADRWVSRAFVGDAVPTTGQGGHDDGVVQVLL